MEKIWGCQTFLEQSFEQWEDQVCLFQVRGDSMLMVNKSGVRVMNEKEGYDSRVRVHWEKQGEDYNNHFLFLIGDHRCVDKFGANFAKTWPADLKHKWYIKGETMSELSKNISKRLVEIEPKLLERDIEPFKLEVIPTCLLFNSRVLVSYLTLS